MKALDLTRQGLFSNMDKPKKDVSKIANSVLEKPIEFTITRDQKPNWIDRLLIKLGFRFEQITFEIKRPTLRMNYSLTELFESLENIKPENGRMDAAWQNAMRLNNTGTLAEILATYIHGHPKEKTPQSLVDFIWDNVDEDDLLRICKLISAEMDIIPFTISIALMKNLDVISQGLMEASLPNTGEIIAPGDLSETLQSTSGGL